MGEVLARSFWRSGVLYGISGVTGDGPSTQTDGDDTGGNTNGAEGCENPEVVETFTESNSQITPPFEISGNTFRLSLETDLAQEGEVGFMSIDSVDEEGLVVPFVGIFVNPAEGPTRVLTCWKALVPSR
jgi:hypothetical protein